VNTTTVWWVQLRRVVLLLLASVAVGYSLGQPLLAWALASSAIVGHWLLQLWRIQKWLGSPESHPPEGFGIWGDIFDKIYHLRRKEKQAREQLQSTVDYLRDSFASMRDGAVMVDDKGIIQWSNQAAQQLLGLRYPEDSGQRILNLVRLPEFHQYFQAGDYSESLRFSSGGDPEQFLRVEISRFGDGDRLVFVRDVTTVTRMEQMRRDFVGNVSHELRTPLTVISGYLETILDNRSQLASQFVKPLEQMAQQSARMESLLKDLLWLSRIESVSNIEKREPVDIQRLLEELCDELASSHPARSIDVEADCTATVMGNYRELYSAVSNLLLNALKYSPDDSSVSVRWARTDNDHCELSVRDTGQGIAAVHLPRLTERFYRVDDSRSGATGGTGLGLAIVKHVAAAHNAQLEIDSVYGVGSCFTLVFSCTGTVSETIPTS
jgi:two-component system, OmpR family, phosphate regulon sensor histidine kinase PhoR